MVEPLTQLYHKFLTVSSVYRQKYNKSYISADTGPAKKEESYGCLTPPELLRFLCPVPIMDL